MRTPLLAGNWKMFKTPAETSAFFTDFLPLIEAANEREVVVCPPFIDIPFAVEAASGSAVRIGAQNVFYQDEGAYTGEISAAMLKAAGCEWVIIGHSERRQLFQETDETVLRRVRASLASGLKPIVCVGELLAEREAGKTESICGSQFLSGIGQLTPGQFTEVVVAYEPVWAIGTGKTATPEMAAETHLFLRGQIRSCYGAEAAAQTRILYGGSVKPDNIKALMAQEDIDGALVGGASLSPDGFSRIVNY